jgi:iron complex outermembrane receptor protein
MKKSLKLTLLVSALSPVVGLAADTDLPVIQVTDKGEQGTEKNNPGEQAGIAADGGEYLKSESGVAGSRMGGHGIDPVIRGQGQTRLNVLLDGAYTHGGCPNRMDPPSSYANSETYDKVTVIKGVESLSYGGGGSGGTVLFERQLPTLKEGDSLQGRWGLGYADNGGIGDGFVDVTSGGQTFVTRLLGEMKQAGNYVDGGSTEVRSGYKENSVGAIFGYRPGNDSELQLSLEKISQSDVLFAGAGMDAPESSNQMTRLKYKKENMGGSFERLNVELYNSDVYHLMDNYSLRTLTAPMKMWVPSDVLTKGMRINGDMRLGSQTVTVGIDTQGIDKTAVRYAGIGMINSYLWPGVSQSQTGLFAESTMKSGQSARVKYGLRYDLVDANASQADAATAMMTANQLYSAYYGTTANAKSENNLSGLLRYERDYSEDKTFFTSLSQTVRTADATERYMASNNSTASMRWIGNPDIAPEIHTQLDVGMEKSARKLNYGVTAFLDSVKNFILKDKAQGQDGILLADNATIYRNVNATLYGVEGKAAYAWSQKLQSAITLAYTRGLNDTDGRNIAQIPPLEIGITTDYKMDKWSFGGKLRMVSSQTYIDINGGDISETPGFNVLNLYGAYAMGKAARLQFGINNVTDELYYEHLNRQDVFGATGVNINEPGRTIWLKVKGTF